MLAELDTLAEMTAADDKELCYLAAFPPGHVAGLNVLLRALLHGVPTVFMEGWDPDAALDLVHRHGVTASAGVPLQLAGLLDAAERDGRGTGTLNSYLVGAASVPPVLVERADRAGVAAYRAYGSSEHPTISSGTPDDPVDKRAGTDGRLTPGTRVRIVDADGNDLPPGRDGEIWTRGPEVFAGYRDRALDAEAFTPDGWLRTGDVGRLDEDGYLTVTDRLKDIIVRGGEKISSKEVEDLLSAHPSVAEAAAVAEPDERYGERVCAFVILRPGTALDLEAVRAHFAAHGAARQKTPERLVLVDALPRTPAGKVRKHELRASLR
jgi:acyl-CoA synthetase (AMP-forming)/AMP-acid ligase II